MFVDTSVFEGLTPDKDFIKHVMSFDVRLLDKLTSKDVSRFVVALSQYLIYFKYQYNKVKAQLTHSEQYMEQRIIAYMTPEVLKKYKTKKEARYALIEEHNDLHIAQQDINALHTELVLLSGVDKTISELIAAYKRELTRRENELYQERHS